MYSIIYIYKRVKFGQKEYILLLLLLLLTFFMWYGLMVIYLYRSVCFGCFSKTIYHARSSAFMFAAFLYSFRPSISECCFPFTLQCNKISSSNLCIIYFFKFELPNSIIYLPPFKLRITDICNILQLINYNIYYAIF